MQTYIDDQERERLRQSQLEADFANFEPPPAPSYEPPPTFEPPDWSTGPSPMDFSGPSLQPESPWAELPQPAPDFSGPRRQSAAT